MNLKKRTKNLPVTIIIAIVIVLSVVFLPATTAEASSHDEEVIIYLFYGEGCSACAKAKPILLELAESDPRIGYLDFEIWYNQDNQDLLMEFSEAYDFQPSYIPIIMIGDRYWVGWNDAIQEEIPAYIQRFLESDLPDLGRDILVAHGYLSPSDQEGSIPEEPTEEMSPVIGEDEMPDPPSPEEGQAGRSITLPLIGTIDLSGRSLLFSTLIISFVDGFNPCSLWVLSILLSITLQSRSRKNVLIVGGVFLLVTAFLYGLFIAGVFSLLRFVSFMGWIQVVVALIALGFALINIKDYFWFQKGVSLTISDDKKPGIFKKMRGVLEKSDSPWRMVGATAVFAAGIALVELSCTAGFPVIWSNILAAQEVDTFTFILLLLVYMLVYLLDELGFFLVAVFTLRSSKLEEKHGRVLKLIGGVLMLTLAVVMLAAPHTMNDIGGTLLIFGIAIAVTGLILLVHRVILPKFNITIGTDKKD